MTPRIIAPTVALALLKLEAIGPVEYWGDFALIQSGRPRYRFNCFRFLRRYVVDLNEPKRAAARAANSDEIVRSLWALNDAGRAALAEIKRGRE